MSNSRPPFPPTGSKDFRGERDDHEPAPTPFNGRASPAPLRHALRALASEPDFFRAPHRAIARLRPLVDAERRRLDLDEIDGSVDARLRSWTRLADGAVIGLSYLARLCVDAEARSAVAPLAVMAVGQYGAGCCDPDTTLELQYLLPADQETWERSGRIVAFIRNGLADLGLQHHRDAVGTAVEGTRAAHCDAITAERFATARFLSGQYALYAGFVTMLRRAMAPHVVSIPTHPNPPQYRSQRDGATAPPLDMTKSSMPIPWPSVSIDQD
jgi:hypothetical protein